MTAFGYRALVGFGVPIVLAMVGIFGKRLPRGLGPGWKRTDFYLGVEFTLAGIGAALVNTAELYFKPNSVWKDSYKGLSIGNFTVAFFGLMLFMYVLTMHQEYENEHNTGSDRLRELRMLAGASNVIGFLVLLTGVALMPEA